jgi:hypothetical protein
MAAGGVAGIRVRVGVRIRCSGFRATVTCLRAIWVKGIGFRVMGFGLEGIKFWVFGFWVQGY